MYKVVKNPAMVRYIAASLVIVLVHSCVAQQEAQQFLDAHNVVRAAVNVAPLVWDETVADYAQWYAGTHQADCNMEHSGGSYGENLAWSSVDMSISEAVQMWANEEIYYDYNSNTCMDGEVCGHYTQVVWSNSVRLGCAKVRCNNGGTFLTCNYDPPGNWNGEWPYAMAE